MLRHLIENVAAPIYVVVDALDECQERTSLFSGLKTIQSWNEEHLHILVTSRREPEIKDILRPLATDTIALEESVVDGDIITYVRYRLQHDRRLSKWPDDIRSKIESALVKGANGMFRWVVCQLDAIQSCMKVSLLRKALQALPQTLDETYARMLAQIAEEHIEDTRRILSCLICAFQPLTIEELAETVAIVVEGDHYYDVENQLQEPRDILAICSGLVCSSNLSREDEGRKDTQVEGLRLSHFSVKEYLTSDRIVTAPASRFALDERYAHELLAKLCINCLLWYEQQRLCQDSVTVSRDGRAKDPHGFACYAASHWSNHLQRAQLDRSSSLYGECLEMLKRPPLLRDLTRLHRCRLRFSRIATFDPSDDFLSDKPDDHYLGPQSLIFDSADGACSPLLYASVLGLEELVLKLLASGEDVNTPGSRVTCLTAAAYLGHETVVRLLLEEGARINEVVQDPSQKGGIFYSPTAVHCAVKAGHVEIIKLLLSKGADVNTCRARSPEHSLHLHCNTPLHEAVRLPREKSETIVRLLLVAGANINACGHESSAKLLYTPISRGNNELIDILLNAGVNPNDDDSRERTPLIYAIQHGMQQSTEMLIQRGADLQNIDSRLTAALCSLHYDSSSFLRAIEVLIQVKPSMNTGLLLVAAVKYGYYDSVSLMLKNGASPDARDTDGVAALHAATLTKKDGTRMLKLLLNAGANVSIRGGPFESALQAAAMAGNAEAIPILLKSGAAPDHAGGSFGTALQIAQDVLELGIRRSYHRGGHFLSFEYLFSSPMDDCDRRFLKSLRYEQLRQRIGCVGYELLPRFADHGFPRTADYQAVIDLLQPRQAKQTAAGEAFITLVMNDWSDIILPE